MNKYIIMLSIAWLLC